MRSRKRNNAGFSLVELITVVTLIGVLAVVAGTRFQGRQGFVEYAYQDRLIAALRNMQIRAMQDTRDGFCYQINFQGGASSAFGPPSLNYAPGNGTATCANGIQADAPAYLSTGSELSDEELLLTSVEVTGGSATNISYLGFDGLGRPLNNVNSCRGGRTCRVTISGQSSVSVCVESEGYIHAC